MDILLKAAFAGGVIAFASWLAEKRQGFGWFYFSASIGKYNRTRDYSNPNSE